MSGFDSGVAAVRTITRKAAATIASGSTTRVITTTGDAACCGSGRTSGAVGSRVVVTCVSFSHARG